MIFLTNSKPTSLQLLYSMGFKTFSCMTFDSCACPSCLFLALPLSIDIGFMMPNRRQDACSLRRSPTAVICKIRKHVLATEVATATAG